MSETFDERDEITQEDFHRAIFRVGVKPAPLPKATDNHRT